MWQPLPCQGLLGLGQWAMAPCQGQGLGSGVGLLRSEVLRSSLLGSKVLGAKVLDPGWWI